jgi:hypothetical protein
MRIKRCQILEKKPSYLDKLYNVLCTVNSTSTHNQNLCASFLKSNSERTKKKTKCVAIKKI